MTSTIEIGQPTAHVAAGQAVQVMIQVVTRFSPAAWALLEATSAAVLDEEDMAVTEPVRCRAVERAWCAGRADLLIQAELDLLPVLPVLASTPAVRTLKDGLLAMLTADLIDHEDFQRLTSRLVLAAHGTGN